MSVILLDGMGELTLRQVLGGLMSEAECVDLAVARVRLSALDLDLAALHGLRRCRMLLGHFDARFHADVSGSAADPLHVARLHRLHAFTHSGRLEVRAGGITSWTPDFSLHHALRRPFDGSRDALVFGAHYFAPPYPVTGAALTAVTTKPSALALARSRFEELWELGHDVLPAIAGTLEQLLGHSPRV